MGCNIHCNNQQEHCSLKWRNMIKIYFNNIKCLCLRQKIKKLFQDALIEKQNEISSLKDKNIEVSLRFADEEEIREIKKEYRGIDKKTDVLSFPLIDFRNSQDVENELLEKDVMLGDIIICKQVAVEQAKEYHHSFKRELCFLALHGFLHLLGYDHIESEDEKIMQSVAKEILEKNKIYR